MFEFLKQYYPQMSLILCIFFVCGAMAEDIPLLVVLDWFASIFWANEFATSVKKE